VLGNHSAGKGEEGQVSANHSAWGMAGKGVCFLLIYVTRSSFTAFSQAPRIFVPSLIEIRYSVSAVENKSVI